MSTHERIGPVGAALVALLLAPFAVQAQTTTPDARWLPYVGCWKPVNVEGTPMRCVLPTEDASAVQLVSYDDGEVTDRVVLHADGRERSVEVEGCAGREQASFSADGHRVYARSSLVCAGEVERESTRLLAMVSTTAWLDVEAVRVLGQSVARVQRYVPAPAAQVAAVGLDELLAGRELAVEATRFAAAADYAVEDVIDATRRVDAEAVRAWIAERGDPLDIDSERLIAMADAGVPDNVIDVAIAVSFPDKFAVGHAPEPEAARGRRIPVGGLYGWSSWRDYYGYRYPYFGFSPYGWGPYGYYGYGSYWGGVPGRVVVVPRVETTPPVRVVKGRGYTRTTASGAPHPSSGSVTRGTVSRSGWSSPRPSTSSKGTTRKAKPRGGSGG